MTSAARRMYLEDGSLVLDIDELVRYAVECYKTEMVNMVLLRKKQAGQYKMKSLLTNNLNLNKFKFCYIYNILNFYPLFFNIILC